MPAKIDPVSLSREEIEQRTAAGESDKQIAEALSARGIDISARSISRRAIEWGLRSPQSDRVKVSKAPNGECYKPGRGTTKAAGAFNRKAEIETRTRKGESAEQIASALVSQGYVFERGASTVLKLQSQWGLVPPKMERKHRGMPKERTASDVKVLKRNRPNESNKRQQNQLMHYPTNCSFGPKKRASTVVTNGDDASNSDLQNDAMGDVVDVHDQNGHNAAVVDLDAEIMAVELLVDLANSTFTAAVDFKDLLLTCRAQRQDADLADMPALMADKLAAARKRVREAAAVMQDLASDPLVEEGLG